MVDPEKVWAASLKGISPSMIKFGLNKLVFLKLDWPPSAPEFAGMCFPDAEDLGLPSLKSALLEVSTFRKGRGFDISRFSYALYMALAPSFYDLDRMRTELFNKKTNKEYQRILKFVLAGRKLPKVPNLVADESEEKIVVSPLDVAKEQLALARKNIGKAL